LKKLVLALEWQFVSRADEPASMSYDKLYWEPFFDCAVIKLFQAKQLTCVPGTFCADYSRPSLNCLSNWAHYAMLERGLVRPEGSFDDKGSAKYRAAMKVFKAESAGSQGTFSKLVISAMRDSIPKELAHIKEKFSAKSIRYGAATHLHADRSITFDESIARGGWSSGTSRDHYIFIQLATMMAPMLSLAGFPDPTIDPVSPSLKPIVDSLSLPAGARLRSSAPTKVTWHDITEYIDKLYANNIPDFKPNGRLRPFLMAITASCIMDFEYQCKTYGGFRKGHDICRHMCDKLCKAKLARTWLQAEEILKQWSQAIKTDFETRVASSASGSPKTMKCMQELLRKCHQSIVGLQAENQRLETKLDTVVQELAEVREQQARDRTQQAQERAQDRALLEQTQANTKAILQALTSGRVGNTSAPQLTLSPTQQTDNETRDGVTPAGVDGGVAQPPRRDAFQVLVPTAPVQACEDVGSLLTDLYQNDSTKFRNLANFPLTSLVPCSSANKKKVEYAMLLAEALLTYQDRQALISGTLSAHDAAAKFTYLNEWIIRATAAIQDVPVTNRRKALVLGVGNIVAANLHLVRPFIPDWSRVNGDPAYAPHKRQTLRDWITAKEEERKAMNQKKSTATKMGPKQTK
jgi:hypothetical protein